MAAEIKYRVNKQNDVWLTDDVYHWNLPNTTLTMLWVDVIANGDITVVEQKDEDWCRYQGRDDKGDFYRYWFTFLSRSGYERRNEYEFSTTVGDETASFTIKIRQKGTLETPTVSDNLNRIIQAKADIKEAIMEKGVELPDNARIDELGDAIRQIPQGNSKIIIPNGLKFRNSELKTFDCSNWDVSNCTNFNMMFCECPNLTTVNLTGWDTSNARDFSVLFQKCPNLTEIIGLEDLNTSSLRTMGAAFTECRSLISVDLSKWDLSKVKSMNYLFMGCTSLTEVKMDSNISSLISYDDMFDNITTTGTFYYNPQYDYSKIIEQLPSTWTAVPM